MLELDIVGIHDVVHGSRFRALGMVDVSLHAQTGGIVELAGPASKQVRPGDFSDSRNLEDVRVVGVSLQGHAVDASRPVGAKPGLAAVGSIVHRYAVRALVLALVRILRIQAVTQAALGFVAVTDDPAAIRAAPAPRRQYALRFLGRTRDDVDDAVDRV